MDRILIVLKKENGPRASSVPALGLNTIIFKYVYWLMKQISGERLQDHWSSGCNIHVYCPGVGADQPLGSNFFQNYLPSVHLPISCKICLSNDILTIFPIQMHRRPMLTLP